MWLCVARRRWSALIDNNIARTQPHSEKRTAGCGSQSSVPRQRRGPVALRGSYDEVAEPVLFHALNSRSTSSIRFRRAPHLHAVRLVSCRATNRVVLGSSRARRSGDGKQGEMRKRVEDATRASSIFDNLAVSPQLRASSRIDDRQPISEQLQAKTRLC